MPQLAIINEPRAACFTIQPTIPLDKDYLRELLAIAVENQAALPVWASGFEWRPTEEAVYFCEREWDSLCLRGGARPPPHRVDLYSVMRGLTKVFDVKYEMSIAARQMVLRSLFEQNVRPNVLSLQPGIVSQIIQLSLFDQIIW